ncbi:unnamed protein product, partial [Rotaria sp. Silwood2]
SHNFLGKPGNEHRCSRGHQLRAFTGIKFTHNNESSLNRCDQTNFNMDFTDEDGTRKWRDVIKEPKYRTWNFSIIADTVTLEQMEERFLFVWQIVGDYFCEKFKPMTFVMDNARPSCEPESYHFILLLDKSGSMGDENRWPRLMDAVNTLIKARKDSGTTQDRITIITFDNVATQSYFNKTMDSINTTTLPSPGGGTDFGAAFRSAIDVLAMMRTNSTNSTLKTIIVFMSDGEANFPTAEVNELKRMRSDIKEFRTVSLSAGPTLKQINDEMDGVTKELKNADELPQAFATIAETDSSGNS